MSYTFSELMQRLTSPQWRVILVPSGFMFLLSVHRKYGVERRKNV